jgi:hypothetical protein
VHQLHSLPVPCITNVQASGKLLDAIKSATTDGRQDGTNPPVVQLLGMGGMGKSTLALQAAFELQKGV